MNLDVTIITPQQVLYSGQTISVSSKNNLGSFDILPEHASFITLIQNSPIALRTVDNQHLEFTFPLAILHLDKNKVTIYTAITSQAQQ